MPPTVDKPITHVVIVGGGVMGLSCCHSIASQHPGYRVTLVDSSTPDTVRSSRGDSRGLQFGYEGVYSGLVKESARLWLQLEQHDAKKRALVAPCGNLAFGTDADIRSLLEVHARNAKEVEVLSQEEILRRWPAAQISASETRKSAVFDPEGHGIDVTNALEIFRDQALKSGAEIFRGDEVTKIDRQQRMVFTKQGRNLEYHKLVLCAGPWTNKVLKLSSLPLLPLFVSNEQLIYIRTPEENHGAYASGDIPEACPIVGSFRFVGQENRPAFCFMVPHFDGVTGKSMPINNTNCVKVAVHQQGELMSTDDFVLKSGSSPNDFVESAFHRRELTFKQDLSCDLWQHRICEEFIEEHLPSLQIADMEIAYRCLYTNTTDNNFVIGALPIDNNVIVAAGFHGEGFKFAPSIGLLVAQCVSGESMDPVMDACFSPRRFFLADMVQAAFRTNPVLSKSMARSLLDVVYGRYVSVEDLAKMIETIDCGSDTISHDHFMNEVAAIGETLRVRHASQQSLGPMQTTRRWLKSSAVLIKGTSHDLVTGTVNVVAPVVGYSVQVACIGLFCAYMIVGVMMLTGFGLPDHSAHPIIQLVATTMGIAGVVGLLSVHTANSSGLLFVQVFNLLSGGGLLYSQTILNVTSCAAHIEMAIVLHSLGLLFVGASSIATWRMIVNFKKPMRKQLDLERLVSQNRSEIQYLLDKPVGEDDSAEHAAQFEILMKKKMKSASGRKRKEATMKNPMYRSPVRGSAMKNPMHGSDSSDEDVELSG